MFFARTPQLARHPRLSSYLIARPSPVCLRVVHLGWREVTGSVEITELLLATRVPGPTEE